MIMQEFSLASAFIRTFHGIILEHKAQLFIKWFIYFGWMTN